MRNEIEAMIGDTSNYFTSSATLLNELKEILCNGEFSKNECQYIVDTFLKEVNYNDEKMSLLILNESLLQLAGKISEEKLSLIYEKLSSIDKYS